MPFCFSAGDAQIEPMVVEFADGARELPTHIMRAVDVEQFKSAEYLAVLKEITWPVFLSAVEQAINQAALESRFGAQRMLEVNRKQQHRRY